MRKLTEKKFETVASILIVAAFAAVAMILNGGTLAYFGYRDLNNMTNVETVRDSAPIYAENIWKGHHIWKLVDFKADGALSLADFVRQMHEKMAPSFHEGRPNPKYNVHIMARHADGTVFLDTWVHNLRTNAGINWQYGQMAGTAAAVCNYIGLSNASLTPNATDTTLLSEITVSGLGRAGPITSTSYNVHVSNATSYTLANTFTATGTIAAQDAAIFNGAYSGGTMCFENTFTQASLVTNDTLTVTWTITF